MEKSTAGTNKRSPDGLSHPNRNTIIINNLVKFYKKWKKNNEIQLTKNKMDLNNLKMTNHPPSPEEFSIGSQLFVGIYLAFCLNCFTLRNIKKIKKSQNPSYVALAYLPQRQWMNYTTNRTLPATGETDITIKTVFIILGIFRIYSSIRK